MTGPAFTTTTASTDAHLAQIHALMRRNMKSPDRDISQGFLSVEYTPAYLKTMLETTPPVVALSATDSTVIGYALAVAKEVCLENPFLREAVEKVDAKATFEGVPLRDWKYIVMGQICVDEAYRGCGVVPAMYATFREVYKARGFELVETEVARLNLRSAQAHKKAGWVLVEEMEIEGVIWDVIVLDLRRE
ncbi:hypothetical protein HDU98_002475 [Podochytrium sp. JEL0797]|nr:hypothetical protein HDU98_002475 [Podochytrium sp. JEL0797]